MAGILTRVGTGPGVAGLARMSDNAFDSSEEARFAKLVRSVRPDASPPPGAQEALREQVMRKASSLRPTGGAGRPRGLWKPLSAAAAVLIACAAGYLLLVRPSVSLADVLQNVRKAISVTYRITLYSPGQTTPSDVCMKRPGLSRITYPDGKVHISDAVTGRLLRLSVPQKTAMFSQTPPMLGVDLPLDMLQHVHDSDGKFLREELIEGKRHALFQIHQANALVLVWADAQTRMPSRIEVTNTTGDNAGAKMVLESFAWNRELSDDLFVMKVPPGFTVEQPIPTNEKTLLESLRICAEINSGQFPDRFDMDAICRLLLKGKNVTLEQPNAAITTSNVDEKTKLLMRTCLAGLKFVDAHRKEGNWSYQGAGVKAGQSGKAICWWKDSASGQYRVVLADLQVQQMSSAPP